MNMKRFFTIFSLIIFASKTFALELTLTQGTVKPTPIAITNLFSSNDSLLSIGKNISSVISDNLERSGLFIPVDQKAFIQSTESLSNQPRFQDWKVIKAQHLVAGRIEVNDDKISIEFKLYDVFSQKQIIRNKYETSKNNWRRVAHIISDAIFTRVTGEGGFFDTRIVYVAETGPKDNRQKRLAIMDQDQANHRFLTDGSYLVLTPRFSPNSQKITYMSYVKSNSPRVFIFDIETGQQEIVGEFPGMTFAPRFSPDGKKIIMSFAMDGNSDIYTMDLENRIVERITNHPSIDTSPSYSPDGKFICFNSDRSGYQQIYIMKSNGKNVKRISFGNGLYGTPVWSPRGDLIAFTKLHKGKFYIGVMRTDGKGERLLTENFYQEAPSWSPNGRVLIFYRETKSNPDGEGFSAKLWSIDLTGYNERLIKTETDGSDPSWSSLLSK